ncbi:MAG: type I DNA topoisomerase [Eubacteriales bacterium]|jgi:DNA topoisomerase-1|nr:type I DNA topoisomerase [Clostridiales bacterium]
MSANLVIIESPHKANTIKGFLGSSYKVLASNGHVRDLPKSTLGVDIENGFAPRYINIRGKGELIRELKKEVKAAERVYLAADPDREGEAISWHLAVALDIPEEKIRRVTFNELTKTAVRNGFKSPRPIDMNLVNSQQARRILDRIVGYKLSPFLWKKVRSGLSAGRVQSVATRIIVEREEEIRAFVPEEYWTVEAVLGKGKKKFRAKYYGDLNERGQIDRVELKNGEQAHAVVDSVTGKPFRVLSVKKAVRQKNPAPPFITSTLLQEASRKLGFQSQRIMRVAQELYEGVNLGSAGGGVHGLITYMRTDSLRVSSEAAEAAKEYIIEEFGEKYYPQTPRSYKTDASAQDAHEAIRPTDLKLTPDSIKKLLTPDQYKLYKLIWSRFVASQMASAELDTVTAELETGGRVFRASGYTVRFNGYLAVYGDADDKDEKDNGAADRKAEQSEAVHKTKLPELVEGEELAAESVSPEQHFTEPPPRFTEGSLIKFLKDKGIGRPSTYTPIITTIIERGYVKREGKTLVPTPLGEITTKIMVESFTDIVDYEFTAQMEEQLDNIENGKLSMLDVLSEFYTGFEASLIKAEQTVSREDINLPVEETDLECEKCGSRMIVKNGRYGKFAACPNYPECKNTKPLDKNGNPTEKSRDTAEPTDEVCDKCGAQMVKRHGRYGEFLACSRFPDCKNTKQILHEIGVKCPKCGKELVRRYGRNRSVFYSCMGYPDCDFVSWDQPTNETCPNCGKPLYIKKGKRQIVCKEKSCGYKRDLPEEDENGTSEAGSKTESDRAAGEDV